MAYAVSLCLIRSLHADIRTYLIVSCVSVENTNLVVFCWTMQYREQSATPSIRGVRHLNRELARGKTIAS